jgi:mercuric ion transport protein
MKVKEPLVSSKQTRLPILGGVLAAVGASLCCTGPLLLLLLGVSGSWIGQLTQLEPYRPLFILAVLVLFAFAGWRLYRPIDDCEAGTACGIPRVRRRRQIMFWISLVMALLLVTSNYWVIWFV